MFVMPVADIPASKEALSRMFDNTARIISQVASGTAPQRNAYHYTNGAGLLGIVSSSAIWATHINCMNDAAEYQEAGRVFKLAVEEAKSGKPENEADARIISAFVEPNPHEKKFGGVSYVPWFVSCFSLRRNDLSQWRGYTDESGKFSLGMDLNHLGALTRHWNSQKGENGYPTVFSFLAPAIYAEDKKLNMARAVIDFARRQYPADEAEAKPNDPKAYAASWVYQYLSFAIALGPLLKNENFAAEDEWRLVVLPTQPKQVEYRMKGDLLTPYMELQLRGMSWVDDKKVEWRHPLREFWVGPSAHVLENFKASKFLLEKYDWSDVKIERSEIPFREI